jgi:hypothetical protein
MSFLGSCPPSGACPWSDYVEAECSSADAFGAHSDAAPAPDLSRFLDPGAYYRMMDSSSFFVYGYENAKWAAASPHAIECAGELDARTVVVGDLPPDLDRGALFSLASGTFGAVAQFDELPARGAVAIRFFDLRDARMLRLCSVRHRARFLRSAFGALLPVVDRRKPPNNGTLAVFHLPAGVSERALWEAFRRFGEIRMVRETPHKAGQRFVEFWDTRAAEAALTALGGKTLFQARIAVEFSLPGGSRRDAQLGLPLIQTVGRWHAGGGCGR